MARFTKLVVDRGPQPRARYPSDLTDPQWAVIEPLLQPEEGPGRPTEVDLREVVNTLLYMKQTGCPWRYIPHDLLPRSTVYYYYEKWTLEGTLEATMQHVREKVRGQDDRTSRPTAGSLDSQTVKSVGTANEVGWDGGK